MKSKKNKCLEWKDLWSIRKPVLTDCHERYPLPSDPWEWALRVCQEDEFLIGTAMRWVFEGQEGDSEMIYAARGDATEKVRKSLVDGVRRKAAVQLQSNALDRRYAEYKKFSEKELAPALKQAYPFGYTLSMDLFVTGSEHVYNAHCDMGDGILLQLHGKKLVKAWGPAPAFYENIIFDHDFRSKPALFDGHAEMFELHAGDALYFHAGMMHEISIPEGSESVSVGIRPERVYPIVPMCEDLNIIAGVESAVVPLPDAAHWDKFRAKVFDPNRFVDSLAEPSKSRRMPAILKSAFLSMVKAKDRNIESELPTFLDRWWSDFCTRREHCPTGATPRPPANRSELLRQWERERLSSRQ